MYRHFPRTLLALSMASAVNLACGDDEPSGNGSSNNNGGNNNSGNNNNGGNNNCPMSLTQSDITCSGTNCTVPAGNFAGAIAFDAANQYLLAGRVFMGDGTTTCNAQLTIAPGTQIFGNSTTQGYLAILPNSTINANGTAQNPIVFSSDSATPDRGDWGGIIISGNAPVNCGGTGVTCNGEGDTGAFGGTNPDDNSGTLRYVRVEFGGNQVNANDELNGIAFQGVGNQTTVEHIHVHKSKDDGVEFFGGTVNARWVITTGIGDDNIDWVFGWTGRLQFAVVQQHPDEADQGIEADNWDMGQDNLPRSNPILSNVTLVGARRSSQSDIGILLREGTGGQIWNSIVMSFNDAGLDIDTAQTFANAMAADGNLAIANTFFYNPTSTNFKADADDVFNVANFVMGMGAGAGANTGNMEMDPAMNPNVHNIMMPNFVPTSTSPVANAGMGPTTTGNNFTFTAVTYAGAVQPGEANPWYSWTTFR